MVTSKELERNLELAFAEAVNDVFFYVDSGITSITFKDRKPIRAKSSLMPESYGLLLAQPEQERCLCIIGVTTTGKVENSTFGRSLP
jgi:hypothetical protein